MTISTPRSQGRVADFLGLFISYPCPAHCQNLKYRFVVTIHYKIFYFLGVRFESSYKCFLIKLQVMDISRLEMFKLLVPYLCIHLILISKSPIQIALLFTYIVSINCQDFYFN